MFSSSRDLEKLAQEFPKVADWSSALNVDEQRGWLRTLLGKMKNGNPSPKDLLREPYFDDLMTRPSGVNSGSAMAFASHGNINNLRRILDGENVVLPPSSDPSWLAEDKDLLAEQYAAMAQLQERFRTLRKQQPNLYIQYIAKSYVKLPRQKKKVRKVPVGPRPPRPPKPKPLVPAVELPAPPPEPAAPEEPLTRDERRQRNDAVRWFREMKEVASNLAALGAALGPRKARMKQPQPDGARPKPLPPPVKKVAVAAAVAYPESEIASSQVAAPVSPTKHTPRIKLIMTAPNTANHVDEDGDVDILDEPALAPAAVSDRQHQFPPAVKIEHATDHGEEIEITDEPPAAQPKHVSDPHFLGSVAVPEQSYHLPVHIIESEALAVASSTAAATVLPPTAPPKLPSISMSPAKKRGRPPKSASSATDAPRRAAAPRAPPASAQSPSNAVPKKRSLFSVMNEIASNCSSLEQMFESGQHLGRRRAAADATAALEKRHSKSKPQISSAESSDVAFASTSAVSEIASQPAEIDHAPSHHLVVVIEQPHRDGHLVESHHGGGDIHIEPFAEQDAAGQNTLELVDLLDEALEVANSHLLDIEDRGRSRDVKKRKNRPNEWDDRPQRMDVDDDVVQNTGLVAAFSSSSEMVMPTSQTIGDPEIRSSKRVHVSSPSDAPM
jgi:hypothetical protein